MRLSKTNIGTNYNDIYRDMCKKVDSHVGESVTGTGDCLGMK